VKAASALSFVNMVMDLMVILEFVHGTIHAKQPVLTMWRDTGSGCSYVFFFLELQMLGVNKHSDRFAELHYSDKFDEQ
jgi:hypothetical protein